MWSLCSLFKQPPYQLYRYWLPRIQHPECLCSARRLPIAELRTSSFTSHSRNSWLVLVFWARPNQSECFISFSFQLDGCLLKLLPLFKVLLVRDLLSAHGVFSEVMGGYEVEQVFLTFAVCVGKPWTEPLQGTLLHIVLLKTTELRPDLSSHQFIQESSWWRENFLKKFSLP